MGPTDRVIVLIDMDCFFCQVEEKLDPSLAGHPVAVVQYNNWGTGGLIAVNYAARDQGVTRHMRPNEARQKCPAIKLPVVPGVRGKADTSRYRDAGKEVADVLATFTALLQRASVDEAYLDITEVVDARIAAGLAALTPDNLRNTFVVGHETSDFVSNAVSNREFDESNLKLAMGALIAEEMRRAVFEATGYKCSGGVAHNKVLAKLVAGLHKPNKQTVLPFESVGELWASTPIKKITGLGGKFGESLCEAFGIEMMGELAGVGEKELAKKFDEKSANWLINLSKGIENDPVTSKLISKSIGCCKNFPGRNALRTSEQIHEWLHKLAEELSERLIKDHDENQRKAKQIIVGFIQEISKKDVNTSRTIPLPSYDVEKIANCAFEVIKKNCLRSDGSYHVKYMAFSASHFDDVRNVRTIESFFKTKAENDSLADSNDVNDVFLDTTQPIEGKPDEIEFYDDSFRVKSDTKTTKSFFVDYFKRNENLTSNLPETSQLNVESENEALNTKICPDCNKLIDISEFPSHLDYHFALNLSKSERAIRAEVKIEPKKALKAKCSGSSRIMMSFVSRETDEKGEECPECRKRVRIEDLASHSDYHAAKKLHLELNADLVRPREVLGAKKAVAATVVGKKERKRSQKTLAGSVSSFFKPV